MTQWEQRGRNNATNYSPSPPTSRLHSQDLEKFQGEVLRHLLIVSEFERKAQESGCIVHGLPVRCGPAGIPISCERTWGRVLQGNSQVGSLQLLGCSMVE